MGTVFNRGGEEKPATSANTFVVFSGAQGRSTKPHEKTRTQIHETTRNHEAVRSSRMASDSHESPVLLVSINFSLVFAGVSARIATFVAFVVLIHKAVIHHQGFIRGDIPLFERQYFRAK
jgi:hypothetical protein